MNKNNLKFLRQQKGISTSELADCVGVSQPTVTRWELGVHPLSFDYLEKLADALDCEPWELLPTEWQPQTKAIDDQERFFRILETTNDVLKKIRKTAPEMEKLHFVMYLYNEGYAREVDQAANDNEISRAVKLVWRVA